MGGPNATLKATNNGFVRSYRDELFHDSIPNPNPDTIHAVMQAFTPDKLPSISALADAFCVCDNWYSEVPGPTRSNRFYMHAATSAGTALNNWKRAMTVRTIYDSVEQKGLTWAVYSFDKSEVLEFSHYLSDKAANCKFFETSFGADIQAGHLANYTFVIPPFLNSKHSSGTTSSPTTTRAPPNNGHSIA